MPSPAFAHHATQIAKNKPVDVLTVLAGEREQAVALWTGHRAFNFRERQFKCFGDQFDPAAGGSHVEAVTG